VATTQPAQQTQQELVTQKQPEHRTQQISVGGVEAGAAIVQEDADNDDEDEELMVAPQETKGSVSLGQNEGEDEDETTTVVVGQPSVVDVQENIALRPTGSETAINASPEVEKVLKKSPDLEKPDIPKAVSDAGVTLSGPGVIQVDENSFGVSQMPAVTYQQAAVQIKETKLKDSRHWFLGQLMFIWRKLQATKESDEAKTLSVAKPDQSTEGESL
jgi:hypothetical protein